MNRSRSPKEFRSNYPQSTQIEGTDAVFDILLLISVAAEMSADVSLRS
jgi:hypothetical protein